MLVRVMEGSANEATLESILVEDAEYCEGGLRMEACPLQVERQRQLCGTACSVTVPYHWKGAGGLSSTETKRRPGKMRPWTKHL